MKTLKNITLAGLIIALALGLQNPSTAATPNSDSPAAKGELLYQGPWVTTKNKKLNGTMNCKIRPVAEDRWEGRFWGVWQQVPFDYTVQFARETDENNPLDAKPAAARVQNIGFTERDTIIPVKGTAMIDGAHYDWIGILTPEEFKIEFTGSRYEGHSELKRVTEKAAAAK